MSGRRLARDLLAKVILRRRFLAMARREGRNDDAVRLGQEICELVAKAALRYLGVDPPRTHVESLCLTQCVRADISPRPR